MTDEKIISAIARGDEAAIHAVITKYSKLMWSIAGSILHNVASDEDIEECVADVFVYLWKHPEKYDARRGRLKVWLSVIARSQALDRYRNLSKNSAVPLDDTVFIDQVGVCDGILIEETKQMLVSAVRSLKQPEQEILVRRYYYEQKPKEIALALDMPKRRVENYLYRTKLKPRAMISN